MSSLSRPLVLRGDHSNTRAGEGQCDCACVTAVPFSATDCACDCACADSNYADCAGADLLDTPLRLNPDRYHVSLPNNLQTILAAPGVPLVLNESAWAIARRFHRPAIPSRVLRRAEWDEETLRGVLLPMIAGQLLQRRSGESTPLREKPVTLAAWLHVTDRCNLRCAYCYLPHKRRDMSLETGKAAVEATLRSAQQHNYQRVKLKYAGGEPLIRFPLVAALHRYARQRAAQCGLQLDGVVLSNGALLTRERAARLRELDLRLMVSLDGVGAAHDGQRFYANGHGSFADVKAGIENALALGLPPDISVTVTGRNAAALPDVVDWILERGLPFSLNFYRENALSRSLADLQLAEKRIIDGMRAAFARIEANLPQRSLLASLVDRANLATPHLRTCGAGHSYLVFDEQGRVSKCQMQKETAVTDIHDPDPLAAIRLDAAGLQNPTVLEKEGCRHCQWRYWCTGGCPLATFRATGRYDVKSPNCAIYKSLFPDVLRLEGLRILKMRGQLHNTAGELP